MIGAVNDGGLHWQIIAPLCRMLGVQSYLEFGIMDGAHLVHVAKAIHEMYPHALIVGVDRRVPAGLPAGVLPVECTTQEFCLDRIRDFPPFDAVFIDADHHVDAVRNDFWGVFPYVSENGLIFLHDTHPKDLAQTDPALCGTAWEFAVTLSHGQYDHLESLTLPFSPGLTVVRKRLTQTPWSAR